MIAPFYRSKSQDPMSGSMSIYHYNHSKPNSWWAIRTCAICGSKAIGVNFGASTCAPCKAFFRRNARRKEILQLVCQFYDHVAIGNKTLSNDHVKYCSQIRHCTSCRLRRCFDVGMKEELVRTEQEKERYRQLVEANRQRRRASQQSEISPSIEHSEHTILSHNDWTILSNIVNAYENFCLKIYVQKRQEMFRSELFTSAETFSRVAYHGATFVNNISSFLSFLLSLPMIKSLTNEEKTYLCQHNVRPLAFPNLHELEQTCFSEPWQSQFDNISIEFVCGKVLFGEFLRIKKQIVNLLIADPVVTRLWLVVLFFSSPLYCYYDLSLSELSMQSKLHLNECQNSYALLLWNYLRHRHGENDAVRIFSNFIRAYLQMQRFAQTVNAEIRTRLDLRPMNQALNQVLILNRDT